MKNFKETIYIICCLGFSMIIGAGAYEHVAVWPKWSSAPPVSFSMFQGQYGLNPGQFWAMLHPLVFLVSITCLIAFWKTSRKNFLLPVTIAYGVILIATFSYFVPVVMSTLHMNAGTVIDNSLIQLTKKWEILSSFRILILIPCTFYLFLGLRVPVNYPLVKQNLVSL